MPQDYNYVPREPSYPAGLDPGPPPTPHKIWPYGSPPPRTPGIFYFNPTPTTTFESTKVQRAPGMPLPTSCDPPNVDGWYVVLTSSVPQCIYPLCRHCMHSDGCLFCREFDWEATHNVVLPPRPVPACQHYERVSGCINCSGGPPGPRSPSFYYPQLPDHGPPPCQHLKKMPGCQHCEGWKWNLIE